MKKRYWIDNGSIRGDFYRIELTKTYPGIPGFAPEYYDIVIGSVTVKFRDEAPYFQTSGNTYTVLSKADIKTILKLLETGYRKSDFTTPIDKEQTDG